jgi:peptidoglycan/xylan/chitin deacetylase (PgdA/CDA1 family)
MRRLLSLGATALLALALTLWIVPLAAAAPSTVVSLEFDDGVADQYGTLPILTAHGMVATFYVNSGFVGDADHMTWPQLSDLFATGNEIGGHGLTHVNLKKLKAADLKTQINADRLNLAEHGFQPVSFAYPFGSFNATTEAALKAYGYLSGRGVSGVDDRKVFAETIPPLDPYATRTPTNVKQNTTVATIEKMVTGAEQHSGGWVQLVFHHLGGNDAYSIAPADFATFLDWLQGQVTSGVVTVKTVGQVIGGSYVPPLP